MTTARRPDLVFILHSGQPRGFWRSIDQNPDTAADSFRKHHLDLGDDGPASGRLLRDGTVTRYFGPLGKPGSET